MVDTPEGIALTKVKKKVMACAHLDDRSKQIVCHLLKQVFAEIIKEKDVETYSYSKEEYDGIIDADVPDFLKNIFGGK